MNRAETLLLNKELFKINQRYCSNCNNNVSISNFYVNITGKLSSYCNDCSRIINNSRPKVPYGTKWKLDLRTEGLKYCGTCKKVLPFDSFSNNKSSIDGKQTTCSECKALSDERYRNGIHREKNLKRKMDYYERTKHSERHKENTKRRTEKRNYKDEYQHSLLDETRRIKNSLRGLMTASFQKRKEWVKKETKTFELLGADYFTVKKHIESQFTVGMSWENHGEWHIDHIIPLNAAGENKEHLYQLFKFENLQPLWKYDNLSKNDKILNICSLWKNPIVPYKLSETLYYPEHNNIIGYQIPLIPGTIYGKLTAIKEVDSVKHKGNRNTYRRMVECKCSCGNIKIIEFNSLRQGTTKSCGCSRKKINLVDNKNG